MSPRHANARKASVSTAIVRTIVGTRQVVLMSPLEVYAPTAALAMILVARGPQTSRE
jgi:hypothetical protein